MANSNAVLAANTVSLGFKLQLDAVWQRNLPLIRDRLERLDTFVTTITSGLATPQQREDALDIAHKFSGSLGIFGYPAGSQFARNLERLLQSATPDPDGVRNAVQAIRSALNL
jgi:HPt (histidine-containing phosphotransfer) domain-containing protein